MSGHIQGWYSKKKNEKGARAQTQAFDQATAEQRRQYDQNRADVAPWMSSGRNALGRLDRADSGDMSDFYASPDYNFTRSEGLRGIEASAAARGGAYSGNALRALNEFNANLASREYRGWYGNQLARAGLGQQATMAGASLGQQSANNISDLMVGRGNARASGIIGGDAAYWNRYDIQHDRGQNIFGMMLGSGMMGGGG